MEERIVEYRGNNISSLYKARISVGCESETCVRVKVLGNGIPNHLSNRPSEEVQFSSETG